MRQSGFVAWSSFSADGNLLLTVRDRLAVQIWEWRSGARVGRQVASSKVLFSASFSPNAKTFLVADWTGQARLHDTATGTILAEFHHEGELADAAFSPDGKHIALACYDGNAWV